MSKRRKVGDVVYKRACAGFVGEGGLVRILDDGSDSCMLSCGDADCLEWNTVEAVDGSGYACHVSDAKWTTSQRPQ